METRVFLTAAELDLFTLLASGPLSLEEAAAARGAEPRGLAILLDALAAMGLLEKSGGRWRTVPALVPFLSSRGERSLLPLALHSVNLWTAGRASPGSWAARAPDRGPRRVDPLLHRRDARRRRAPGRRARRRGRARRRAPPPRRRRGTGHLHDRVPAGRPGPHRDALRPPRRRRAGAENVAAAGLLDRVDLVAGDLRTDALPGGHDLAFVSAIIHMLGPSGNVALFRKVHDALVPEGRVVIRDHVMSADRTARAPGLSSP